MFWIANLMIIVGVLVIAIDKQLSSTMKMTLAIILTTSVMSAYSAHETHVHTHQLLEHYGVKFDENGKEINP